MQDSKDMFFPPKNKSEINLGVIEEEEVTSINDKLARKIHRWVQSLTNSYSNDNENVAQYSQNVKDQEYNKKDFLLFWILCEAQEDKVRYIVPWFHLVLTRAEFVYQKQFTYETRGERNV